MPYLRGRALLPAQSVTLLGSTSSSVASSTLILTTTNDIAVNDLVIMGGVVTQATATASTMSLTNSGTAETWVTSKTNTDLSATPSTVTIFHTLASAAHLTGSTITVSATGTPTDLILCGFRFSTEQLPTPITINVSSTSNGVSSSAAPTNATPTVNPTLGVMAVMDAAITTVAGGGWTQRFKVTSTLTSKVLYLGSIVKGDQVGINNATTLTASGNWAASQVFFPATIQNRLSQMSNTGPVLVSARM